MEAKMRLRDLVENMDMRIIRAEQITLTKADFFEILCEVT